MKRPVRRSLIDERIQIDRAARLSRERQAKRRENNYTDQSRKDGTHEYTRFNRQRRSRPTPAADTGKIPSVKATQDRTPQTGPRMSNFILHTTS